MKIIKNMYFTNTNTHNILTYAQYTSSTTDTSNGQVPTQKAAVKARVIMGVPGQETYPTASKYRKQNRTRRCNRKFI